MDGDDGCRSSCALTCLESSHSQKANDFVRLSNFSGHDFESGRVKIISWAAKKVVDGVKAQYIADRDLFKLTYFWKERSELDYYRRSVLKVGASLILPGTPNDFVENIESLDAEWHRGQSRALENEYVGNEVRVNMGGEETNGVVWGWLPAGDPCNFENRNRWKLRFVECRRELQCMPMILNERETIEAIERHARWKDSGRKADTKMLERFSGFSSAPLGKLLSSEIMGEATTTACTAGACAQESAAASSSLQDVHGELRKRIMAGVVGQRLIQGVYKPGRPLVTDSRVSRIPVRLLNTELLCPICLSICRCTHTIMECLHRFCQECIEKHLRLGHNECPKCRVKVSSRRALRPDPLFDGLIRALYPDTKRFQAHEDELICRVNTESAHIAVAVQEGLNRQSNAVKRYARTSGSEEAPPAKLTKSSTGKWSPPTEARNNPSQSDSESAEECRESCADSSSEGQVSDHKATLNAKASKDSCFNKIVEEALLDDPTPSDTKARNFFSEAVGQSLVALPPPPSQLSLKLPLDAAAPLDNDVVIAPDFLWADLPKPEMTRLSAIVIPMMARSPAALTMDSAGVEESKARSDAARIAAISTDFRSQGKFYDKLSTRFPIRHREYLHKIKTIIQQFSKTCRERTRNCMRAIFQQHDHDTAGIQYVRNALKVEPPVFNSSHPLIVAFRKWRPGTGSLIVIPAAAKAGEGTFIFDKGALSNPVLANFHDLICNLNRVRPDCQERPIGSITEYPFLPEGGIDRDEPLFNAFTGYMWFECYSKFTSMRRVLLPGPNEDFDQVFERKAADGELYITEHTMAFFDYNVAACLAQSLANEEIMDVARQVYARRIKAYKRRAVPVPRRRVAGSGGGEEFLPTWRDELKTVLRKYMKVALPASGVARMGDTDGGHSDSDY